MKGTYFAISTSGNSNIVNAITAGHEHKMKVILLSGKDGGKAALKLTEKDLELRVPVNPLPEPKRVT